MNADTVFFKLSSTLRCHSLLALKAWTYSHCWPVLPILQFSTWFCSPGGASFVPESLQCLELSFWSDFAFSLWDGTENPENKGWSSPAAPKAMHKHKEQQMLLFHEKEKNIHAIKETQILQKQWKEKLVCHFAMKVIFLSLIIKHIEFF